MDQLTGMRVFVRVAELNSFSRAAEDLEIAQSTVTKTVAWLENRLGTRLINRNTRGLTLNEAGKLYYETCRAILRQIEEAEGLVRRHDAELDGTLRISTSVAFGEAVLGPMLLPFIAANPRLRVDLTCEDNYVDLIARGIDVALRMGRLTDSSLGGRYLGANPWVMVASPRLPRPRQAADHARRPHRSRLHRLFERPGRRRLADAHTDGRTMRRACAAACAPTTCRRCSRRRAPASAWRSCPATSRRAIEAGELTECLSGYVLPDQELYAVFPSPKLVPRKVTALIRHLAPRLRGAWWQARDGNTQIFPGGINKIEPPAFSDQSK